MVKVRTRFESASNLRVVSRGKRWSTRYLDSMVAAWAAKPEMTSLAFVTTHAPTLPARTLRHRAQQLTEVARRSVVIRLHDELAKLKAATHSKDSDEGDGEAQP